MKTITIKATVLTLISLLAMPVQGYAQSATVGGNGGSSYNVSCAANEVLVGVSLRSGSTIDQLSAYCVSVDDNGQWTSSTMLRGGSIGGNGGQPATSLCPTNHAVVGFNGSTGLNSLNNVTGYLQLRCGLLESRNTTTTQMLPLEGFGATTPALRSYGCPDGIAANGIYGRASDRIDQFGLNCHATGLNKPGKFGRWSDVLDWPLIGIHAVLTPQGEVLTYGTDENGIQGAQFFYDVWTPSSGTGNSSHFLLNNSLAVDSFCGAPLVMPDNGNVLMPGGDQRYTGTYNTGIVDAPVFNTSSKTLSRASDMGFARWYPTSTVLQNGEILVAGGIDGAGAAVITPEIYTPSSDTWRSMFGATSQTIFGPGWWYPHHWLAPDGRVFGMSGSAMYYIDVNGNGATTQAGRVPDSAQGTVATGVMYRPGKIMQVGGGSTGVGAFTVDINGGAPITGTAASPRFNRGAWSNSSVLPDGTVLVTGGSPVANTIADATLTPELWNPDTDSWQQLSSAQMARLYHSTSLLLPDARVLITGGGAPGPQTNLNAELFSPPYLFNDQGSLRSRIEITQAPQAAGFNATAAINYVGETAARVTLVKTGAVTHSFNMEQRFVDLTFSRRGNQLIVDIPDVSVTPPGYYMLFLLDSNGTPSVARIIKLSDESSNVTPLVANATVQGSVSEGEWKYFNVTNADNYASITSTLTGLNADVDLYVSEQQPTLENYECRSWNSGSADELCIVSSNASMIGVYGHRAGSFTLSVTGVESVSSNQINLDQPVVNSIAQNQWHYFTIPNSQDYSELSISLNGLTADIDLYIGNGYQPTLEGYDCRSWNGGPDDESCIISGSDAVVVGIFGYRAGTYTLTVTADYGQTTGGQTTDGQTTDGATTAGNTTDGQTTAGGGSNSISPGERIDGFLAQGEWRYFSVESNGISGSALASLTGLSADLDLYVLDGANPTLANFDCRSWIGGTRDESCGVQISGGNTIVGVYGYQAGSFSLVLGAGVNVTELSVPFGSSNRVGVGMWQYYRVGDAAGFNSIVADLTDMSSDGDLYMKIGAVPSTTDFDCRSFASANANESCSLDMESEGVYIGVYGYQSTEYSLTVNGSNVSGRNSSDKLISKQQLTQDAQSKGFLNDSMVGVGAGASTLMLPLLALMALLRRRIWLLVPGLALVWAGSPFATPDPILPAETSKGLQVAEAPDFKETVLRADLIDQDNQAFRLSDFSGQTVLINFIFTGCSTICPMQTHELLQVQNRVNKSGLKDRVKFVSITITPESDPPAAMKMFARNHRVDQDNWVFATGNKNTIHAMGEALWVGISPNENGQTDHRTLLYLVGPNGLLLQRYRGEPVDIDRVSREIAVVDELNGQSLADAS